MTIHTLHIGINNYKGTDSDLRGCVNDALDMAGIFPNAESKLMLLDDDATRANMIAAATDMLARLRKDDWGVITFSGHGTYLRDRNNDEDDSRDEALVCADLKLIVDDEFRGILSKRVRSSRLFVVTDSCHSGTVHRFFGSPGRSASRVRYLPSSKLPKDDAALKDEKSLRTRANPTQEVIKFTRALTNVIHFAGCRDFEYSYDAEFDGRPNGAMTYHMLKAFTSGISFGNWYRELAKQLPTSEYPQVPIVNASKASLKLFVPR